MFTIPVLVTAFLAEAVLHVTVLSNGGVVGRGGASFCEGGSKEHFAITPTAVNLHNTGAMFTVPVFVTSLLAEAVLHVTVLSNGRTVGRGGASFSQGGAGDHIAARRLLHTEQK